MLFRSWVRARKARPKKAKATWETNTCQILLHAHWDASTRTAAARGRRAAQAELYAGSRCASAYS